MSTALPLAPTRASALLFPPEMLEHLGITAKHLEALDVLGLTVQDAVARGVLRLPEWITPDQFPQYFRNLQTVHEMGMTLEEWSASLDEVLCEGSADDVIRFLDDQEACGS